MTEGRAESTPDAALLGEAARHPVRPTGRREALLTALEKIDPTDRLPAMYWAAVALLDQQALLPDRLPLAAHAMRELMDNLPRHRDFLLTGKHASRRDNILKQVQDLRDKWKRYKDGGGIRPSPIEPSTALPTNFVSALDRFFDGDDFRSKDERTRRDLVMLDPMGRPLPEAIQRLLNERWRSSYSYFSGVSHHQSATNDTEFLEQLNWLEDFLLDRLRPRTFANQEKIDQLIREAEGR